MRNDGVASYQHIVGDRRNAVIDQLLAAIDAEWLSTGDDRIENGARTNEPPSRARSATRLSIETQHLIIRRPNIVNIGGCLQRARSEWDTSPACPVLDISHPPADEFDAAPILQIISSSRLTTCSWQAARAGTAPFAGNV